MYGDGIALFVFLRPQLSHEEASLYCQAEGGHLATILDAEENAFVLSMARTYSLVQPWIGLYSNTSAAGNASAYYWLDGSNSSYRNFHPTDAPLSSSCVQTYTEEARTANGSWIDTTCDPGNRVSAVCRLTATGTSARTCESDCSITGVIEAQQHAHRFLLGGGSI